MIEWTLEKIRRLTELVCDDAKYSEYRIAEILTDEFGFTVSRDAVHNTISRLNLRKLLDKKITDIMPYFTKYAEIIKGTGVPKELDISTADSFVSIDSEKLKLLHISDLHIPFQVDEQVQEATNKHAGADVVVVNELLDCYSLSRFGKFINVPFEIEIDNGIRVIEYLSENFPIVILFSGNHDKRIRRESFKGVPSSLLFLVEDDIISQLAKPFSNVYVIDAPFVQINDAVFIHAEMFSRIDLKAGVNAYQYLREWQDVFKLPSFKVITQAHTHMVGATYRAGEIKIMESGCLCRIPDYAVDKCYTKPQTNGYVVINQTDGVTDFNSSREFVFPSQPYIKNWTPVAWS